MTPDENTLGLIAGEGRLPFLVAQGAKKAGQKVICVGLKDSAEISLGDAVDVFYEVAVARPGSWIRKLKKHGVTRTIMVGRVAKSRLFTPWRILRYLPDWRAFRIYYWRLRGKNKQNETVLNAIADELASGGIVLGNTTTYCKEHLATAGVMTGGSKYYKGHSGIPEAQRDLSAEDDIEFGWQLAKKIAELDIGQAIAVKEKEVIAVEAIEGTANMIERAGKFCKSGGWTLIKVSRPNQDMRFDVPCVGPDTIRSLSQNGAKCLVVEAGKTIIIDKPETIKLAEQLGITILGS